MKIHHVGYLVKDIRSSIKAFTDIVWAVSSSVVRDDARGVDICFIENNGCVAELISPVDKESPMYPLLKKIGNAPYHFCYSTPDIAAAVLELTQQHYMLISRAAPAPAIDNKIVCFLVNADIGMIELVEEK